MEVKESMKNKYECFTKIIPSFMKSLLRPITGMVMIKRIQSIMIHQKNLEEIHEYWKAPCDGDNLPSVDYLGEKQSQKQRSRFLVELVKEYANKGDKIFEVGCNVGRNLHYLFEAGYKNLEAVEISHQALTVMKQAFPEMEKNIYIYNESIEGVVKSIDSNNYDMLFTMAVLEHIHKDSEWIFKELVRITKRYLITIEDEEGISWRHFPRNYKRIFEHLGMQQLKKVPMNYAIHGLHSSFCARVFIKR
jgi:2-polyprenyl-3-methyl-5-hydroxy-6-metoxy-1,4-benzoquinol methylase